MSPIAESVCCEKTIEPFAKNQSCKGGLVTGCEALPNIPWEEKPKGHVLPVWRFSGNPITGLSPHPGMYSIYNSAVVPFKGAFAGVFRSDHADGLPYLHTGWSKDGITWDVDPRIIDVKIHADSDISATYAYDPRVTLIDGRYYVTWCNGYKNPTIGIAWTTDFKTYHQLDNAFLPYNRNGVLFPRKVNGKYMMLSRPSDPGHTPFGDIWISESPDMVYWGKHRFVMGKGGGWWQDKKIGAGPSPIETSEGWLLLYHGVRGSCNGLLYSMGVALLDLDDPSKVIARSSHFILHPETPYETAGLVPNVCFPCAALCDAATNRLAIYYGAADTYVALAFAKVDELIAYAKANSK